MLIHITIDGQEIIAVPDGPTFQAPSIPGMTFHFGANDTIVKWDNRIQYHSPGTTLRLGDHWSICPKCGMIRDTSETYLDCPEWWLMQEKGICFSCAFWTCICQEWKSDSLWIRIAGVSYYPEVILQNGETKSRDGWKGFGGRQFTIQFHDDREIRTDNLWCQGEIPQWLREEYPDNAEFI